MVIGATIATLDAVMLHEQLDSSVKITVVVFGLPRMGNQYWANYVDSTVSTLVPVSLIFNHYTHLCHRLVLDIIESQIVWTQWSIYHLVCCTITILPGKYISRMLIQQGKQRRCSNVPDKKTFTVLPEIR